jgi:hypothetical protein
MKDAAWIWTQTALGLDLAHLKLTANGFENR